jgi:hypothetical protein
MVIRWTSKDHRGCLAMTNLVVDSGGEHGLQVD